MKQKRFNALFIVSLFFLAAPLFAQISMPSMTDEVNLIQQQLDNQQAEENYNELIKKQASLLTANQTTQPTTTQQPANSTAQASSRKTTLTLENFLRSKLIGMDITYYHQSEEALMTGQVLQIYRKTDAYYAIVANSDQSAGNMVRVHFVKDYKSHLKQGSDLISKKDNYDGRQIAFDSEKKVSEMMQPLLGNDQSAKSQLQFPPRPTTSFRDIVSKADSESEPVEVIDPSTKERTKSRVVVYEKRVRLLDGTPLSMLFEKE